MSISGGTRSRSRHGVALHRPSEIRTRGGTIVDAVFIIVVLGLLAMAIFWIIKTMGHAGQQYATAMVDTMNDAAAIKCQSNMRSIWQCVQAYATENDALPPSQEELMHFCGGSRLFHCDEPNAPLYVYIPGQRQDMSPSNVLVYEPLPVHQGRSVVLFSDGHMDMLTSEALNQAVAATLASLRQRR